MPRSRSAGILVDPLLPISGNGTSRDGALTGWWLSDLGGLFQPILLSL